MLQYKLYIDDNGCEIVNFGNNIIRDVTTDEDGRRFFNVPNFKNPPSNSFVDRITDAIEYLRKGNGHAIASMFGKYTNVRFYLDSEYGENIRQATLNGFGEKIKEMV